LTCLSVVALAFAGLLLHSPGAEAAKISVKNCQAKAVRLCVYDDNSQKDDKILAQNERIHSTCKSRCRFKIVECASATSCNKCYSYDKAVKKQFGRGTYVLVGLKTVSSSHNQYLHDNFTKVSDDPTKNDRPISCPE